MLVWPYTRARTPCTSSIYSISFDTKRASILHETSTAYSQRLGLWLRHNALALLELTQGFQIQALLIHLSSLEYRLSFPSITTR